MAALPEAERKDFKVPKEKFQEAYAAYELENVKATVAILEALVVTSKDNAGDLAKYEGYLKFMKEKVVPAATKQKDDKAAAAAAAEGGSLMWLWCILIGLVAIVGIFFLYRYCKNKDDKQD